LYTSNAAVTGGLRPVAFSSIVNVFSPLIRAVDQIKGDGFDTTYDGILGLGPRKVTSGDNIPSPYYNPILTTLLNTHFIPAELFNLVLKSITDFTNCDGGYRLCLIPFPTHGNRTWIFTAL
jgi:hypothetical protein